MKKLKINCILLFIITNTICRSQENIIIDPFEKKQQKRLFSYSINFLNVAEFNSIINTFIQDSIIYKDTIIYYSLKNKKDNRKIEFFKNADGYTGREFDKEGFLIKSFNCLLDRVNFDSQIDTSIIYEVFSNNIIDTVFKVKKIYNLVFDGEYYYSKDKILQIRGNYKNNKKNGIWYEYFDSQVLNNLESGFLCSKKYSYNLDTLVFVDTINKIQTRSFKLKENLKKTWEHIIWADFKIDNKECIVLSTGNDFCGNPDGFLIWFNENGSLNFIKNKNTKSKLNFLNCTNWKLKGNILTLFGKGKYLFEVIYFGNDDMVLKRIKH